MSRLVQICVVVVLGLGAVGTYSARAWRDSHALSAEAVDRVTVRLAALPLEITDPKFEGTSSEVEDRIVDLSGADYYAAIDYRAYDGGNVRLYVGVSADTDSWLHEPTVCLPVQGWTTTETKLVPLWDGLPGVEPGSRIWRMELERARTRMIVYYWIEWGDRIVASRFQRSWTRFKNRMAGHADRPVKIVIFYAPVVPTEEATDARIAALARAVWPQLDKITETQE